MSLRRFYGGGAPGFMTRVRLDPDPPTNTSGGSGAPVPNPTPPPTQPPASAEATPPAPEPPNPNPQAGQTLQVGQDWVQQLLADQQRLQQIEAARAQEEAQRRADREAAMAEQVQQREEFQQLLRERDTNLQSRDQRINQLTERLHGRARSEAVAQAMTGVQFASDAARRQLQEVLSSRVSIREQGDDLVAVGPTGIAAEDYLRSLINSDEFAHFRAPSSRGGAGGGGNTPPSDPNAPPDYSAAVIQNWNRLQQQANQGGLPSLGFGGRPPSQ